ncbi:hypothetical protein QYF36_010912 [Acer negundo]|nr:hypothetical protein QYF36_010912 [Acer negundo]
MTTSDDDARSGSTGDHLPIRSCFRRHEQSTCALDDKNNPPESARAFDDKNNPSPPTLEVDLPTTTTTKAAQSSAKTVLAKKEESRRRGRVGRRWIAHRRDRVAALKKQNEQLQDEENKGRRQSAQKRRNMEQKAPSCL